MGYTRTRDMETNDMPRVFRVTYNLSYDMSKTRAGE